MALSKKTHSSANGAAIFFSNTLWQFVSPKISCRTAFRLPLSIVAPTFKPSKIDLIGHYI